MRILMYIRLDNIKSPRYKDVQGSRFKVQGSRFKVQGSNSFILPKTEETKGTKNIIRGKETPIKAARSR